VTTGRWSCKMSQNSCARRDAFFWSPIH
jgi:hypothetical protein